MNRSRFRRFWAHPLAGMLGGLFLGAVAAGIAAAILVYVVQPVAYQATRGMRSVRAAPFVVWFWDDSEAWAERDALVGQLRDVYERLLAQMETSEELIPQPINALVHDDLSDLLTSVTQRKSSANEQRLSAPVDLFVGADPAGPLAELIAAYGWGPCQSLILLNGFRADISEPGRDFHAAVAALPETERLGLAQLLQFEGELAPSLYQQYAAPTSQSAIGSLADFARLMNVEDVSSVQLFDTLSLHAASFVRFIVETYGVQELSRLWGAGSTARLLQRLPVSLDELASSWDVAVAEAAAVSEETPFLQVYYGLADGHPDEAFSTVLEWETPLDRAEAELAVRCALTVGAFGDARRFAEEALDAAVRGELLGFVGVFDGWCAVEAGRCRVLGPEAMLAELEGIAEAGWATTQGIAESLEVDVAELPSRITLIVHPTAASADAGEAMLSQGFERAAVYGFTASDTVDVVRVRLAESLPEVLYGHGTYSRLLRSGLATALLRDLDELVVDACALIAEQRWIWLDRLDFNRSDEETVLLEAGLLFRYVLDTWGAAAMRRIWVATSARADDLSLDTSLQRECGVGRRGIEERMFESLLVCP